MNKKTSQFWILLAASLLLTILLLLFAFKILKAVFLLMALLLIIPLIIAVLRHLITSEKLSGRSEKLKRRD